MNSHFLLWVLIFWVSIQPLAAQRLVSPSLLKPSDADTVFPYSEEMAVFVDHKGNWGAIDRKGTIVIKPKYALLGFFQEGLAAFAYNLDHSGYVNKKGQEFYRNSFCLNSGFQGGLGEVWSEIGEKFSEELDEYTAKHNPFDVRRNFLDHDFKLLIPYKYDSVAVYVPGKIRLVSRKGKFGFLDQKAQELIPLILEDVDLDSAYYWGDYRRVRYQGKFGFLNTNTGEWLLRPAFTKTLPSPSSITWVSDSLTWKLISLDGQALTSLAYSDVHWVVPGELAAAKNQEGFILVDARGKELTSTGYDDIYLANEEVSVVVKKGAYGYIDVKGNLIAPPVYEKATYFHDGQGVVFGKYAYWHIDRLGNRSLVRLKPWMLVGVGLGGAILGFILYILIQKNTRRRNKTMTSA